MLKQNGIKNSAGRILALLLAMMLGITTVYVQPSQASEAEIIDSGNCTYNGSVKWKLDANGELTISGSGYTSDWDENEYYKKSVKSVVIEDGITDIAGGMFKDCTSLSNVSIPESVTSIGSNAFSGCDSLTDIIIPDGVTIIRKGTFKDCTSLTSVTISNSVTSIDDYAFEGCTSLMNVTIPDSVTSIGAGAFEGCTSLTDITIPVSVTELGNPHLNTGYHGVFKDCTSLVNVNGLMITSRYEFYGCTALKNIVIPDGATKVCLTAFTECTSLSSIKIPKSVQEISLDGEGQVGDPASTVLIVEKPSYAYDWVTDGKFFSHRLRFKIVDQPITITFDSAGGNSIPPMSDVVGNSEIELPIPQRNGYAFEGWYDENGECIDKFDTKYTYSRRITESITLHARWRRNAFTVTFDSAGGNYIPPMTDVAENSEIELPIPQRNGYAFEGWYDGNSDYIGGNKRWITGDITLHACWTRNVFTVTFDTDGGSSIPPVTNIVKGTTVKKPKDPVKKGYVFVGWTDGFEGLNGLTEYNFSDKIDEDFTLKAIWTKNKAKIEKCKSVNIGYTYKLLLSSNAPIKKVKWTSSNKKILKVTKKKKNSVTVKGLKNKKKAVLKAVVTFKDGTKQTIKQTIRVKKKAKYKPASKKYPKGIVPFDKKMDAEYLGYSNGRYKYWVDDTNYPVVKSVIDYRSYLFACGYMFREEKSSIYSNIWISKLIKGNQCCEITIVYDDEVKHTGYVYIKWY